MAHCGNWLIIGGEHKDVFVVDIDVSAPTETNSVAKAKVIRCINVGHFANSLDITENGSVLAVGTTANTVAIFNIRAAIVERGVNASTTDSESKTRRKGRQMYIEWPAKQNSKSQPQPEDHCEKRRHSSVLLGLLEGAQMITAGSGGRVLRVVVVEHASRITYDSAVNSVSLSSSGAELAVGVAKDCLCYCTKTHALLHCCQDSARVKTVALSADGCKLCFSGWGDHVHLQQIQNGTKLQEFDWSHRGEVKDVAVSPNGEYVAVAGKNKHNNGVVLVYFTSTEGIVMSVRREREVRAVRLACLKQKVLMAVAGYDGTCAIYEVKGDVVSSARVVFSEFQGGPSSRQTSEQAPLCVIEYKVPPPRNFIWALAFSEDSEKFAVGVWSSQVQLFDVSDLMAGKVDVKREYKRQDRVYSVALSSTGDLLAVGGRDKQVVVYNTLSETESIVFQVTHDDFIYCVAMARGRVAAGGVDKVAKVYDLETKKLTFQRRCSDDVWGLSLDASGKYLAIGGADNQVQIHDTEEDREVLHIPQPFLVLSVQLQQGVLAFCSGTTATIYGVGAHWGEKPAFAVVQKMLRKPRSVLSFVDAHPSIINFYDARRGLSFLVEMCQNNSIIKPALQRCVDLNFGVRLFPATQVDALLLLATQTTDHELVKLILTVCMSCPPEVQPEVTKCIAILVRDSFPQLVSDFLKNDLALRKTKFTVSLKRKEHRGEDRQMERKYSNSLLRRKSFLVRNAPNHPRGLNSVSVLDQALRRTSNKGENTKALSRTTVSTHWISHSAIVPGQLRCVAPVSCSSGTMLGEIRRAFLQGLNDWTFCRGTP
jgi:WD40 repeat protein